MHLVLCEHVEVLPNGRKCKKTPSHIPRGLLQKLSWIGDNFKIQLPDTNITAKQIFQNQLALHAEETIKKPF